MSAKGVLQKMHELKYKRIVIKVGSNILTGGNEELSCEVIADLARQISSFRKMGGQCVLVSSGAVAAGKYILGIKKATFETQTRQLCAAVGQSRLMHLYKQSFDEHNVVIAQALLSKRDFTDRNGYLNARNTLFACLSNDVVCIVNENDVVSIDELRGLSFGDNDSLSALVANMIDADLLLILSDVGGLYDKNPSNHTDAKLIKIITKVDDNIKEMAIGEAGTRGTGGMTTKVTAAETAAKSGIPTIIAKGNEKDAIILASIGQNNGTLFEPTHGRTESRKRFLTSNLTTKGQINIDSGAAKALKENKSSLLPKGVTGTKGSFKRGDTVAVCADDELLGYGFTNYSCEEIEQIKGCHSKDIITLLGFICGDEIIHANNLVIM